MQQAITTELRLTLSTQATRRNIQELLAPVDISGVKLSNDMFDLAINNAQLNNPESEILLGKTRRFLHITCSIPVEAYLSRVVNGVTVVFPMIITRHFTASADFSEVRLRNSSKTEVCSIRAINS